jgi:hypothetical protein
METLHVDIWDDCMVYINSARKTVLNKALAFIDYYNLLQLGILFHDVILGSVCTIPWLLCLRALLELSFEPVNRTMLRHTSPPASA